MINSMDEKNWIIKVIEWLSNDSDENPYAVIVRIQDSIKYLTIEEYQKLINLN